ncbi:MAG: Holliday junction branch migration protein RuvA [Candidatus Marinimicrobia bacterium]|nr:Holliday junction branch migration protein RuvA [Candidatus Neomarinimicrobiota bacterium]
MYDYITGKLIEKRPTEVVIDVNGLGYKISIPISTYERLPSTGEIVKLFIHLYVRDDVRSLYGFYTKEERELFLQLISISGIGPKMAITILSGTSPEQFKERIGAGDISALTMIPGIGIKTANRIIVELREKFASLHKEADIEDLNFFISGKIEEAVIALMTLGYKKNEAKNLVFKAYKKLGSGANVEELIKEALKSL